VATAMATLVAHLRGLGRMFRLSMSIIDLIGSGHADCDGEAAAMQLRRLDSTRTRAFRSPAAGEVPGQVLRKVARIVSGTVDECGFAAP
jgi:hypothetical protein